MKVAIVHDYLNQLGGAERVVGTLHKMFPSAPIYTTLLDRERLWPNLSDADIRPSWMQRLPGWKRHFKKYLPLYPAAIESFDLRAYDLVISSSSAFAKGAITRSDALHICYCHTPMRFVWDYDRYVQREMFGAMLRKALPLVIDRMRDWDLNTRLRPSHYVANSTVVAQRIQHYYGLPSRVIFPPVETSRCKMSDLDEDYYLVVSRLAPYKRIDLVIETFNELGRPLVIIGDGPDRPVLERMANSNIRFFGRLPDEEVANHFARCRALVFPGEEDFGITPLEANASGRPVLAYQAGGALDTMRDELNAILFQEQTVAALKSAILRFEATDWDKKAIRTWAERFNEENFRIAFMAMLKDVGLELSGTPQREGARQ